LGLATEDPFNTQFSHTQYAIHAMNVAEAVLKVLKRWFEIPRTEYSVCESSVYGSFFSFSLTV
jgi:hypothetical protein